MTNQPWNDLPETPPTRARVSSEAPTVVLEPRAADDSPPPAPSPRRDPLWWRVGGALVLTALLGAVAWLISDRSDAAPPGLAGSAPESPASVPPDPADGAGRLDEVPPDTPAPGERFDFFFEDGELPPELEEFLGERGFGLEFFRDGELPPELEQFLEEHGPDFFNDQGFPSPDEFFGGDRAPDGFSFEGEMPPAMRELIDMLPGLFFAPNDAELSQAQDLINELLADPNTPDAIRRFAERLADRLAVER